MRGGCWFKWVCEHCGKFNPLKRLRCRKCGAKPVYTRAYVDTKAYRRWKQADDERRMKDGTMFRLAT